MEGHPALNLIADLQKKNTILAGHVRDIEEARLFFGTLQVGVDCVFRHRRGEGEGQRLRFRPVEAARGEHRVDIPRDGRDHADRGRGIRRPRVRGHDIHARARRGDAVGNHARGLLPRSRRGGEHGLRPAHARSTCNTWCCPSLHAPGRKQDRLPVRLKAGEPVMIVDWQGHTSGRVAKIETCPMLPGPPFLRRVEVEAPKPAAPFRSQRGPGRTSPPAHFPGREVPGELHGQTPPPGRRPRRPGHPPGQRPDGPKPLARSGPRPGRRPGAGPMGGRPGRLAAGRGRRGSGTRCPAGRQSRLLLAAAGAGGAGGPAGALALFARRLVRRT